jgi:hypothetical protein
MSETTAPPARHANGRFGPGNPGRRAGARNQISHRVAMAILEDFEANQDEVLQRLRTCFTPAYFALLLRLLDRQLQAETASADECVDAELGLMFQRVRAAVDSAPAPHRINGD